MKKIISALLASLMIMSLTACGGSGGDNGNTGGDNGAASGGDTGSTAQEDLSNVDTGDVANDTKVKNVYAEVNPLETIVGQTVSNLK